MTISNLPTRLARIAAAAVLALSLSSALYAQEATDRPSEYIVKAGDTLFNIASRFDTTVQAVKRANGLTGDQIQVGQRLLIPVPAPVDDDESLSVPEDDGESVLVPVDDDESVLVPVSGDTLHTSSDTTRTPPPADRMAPEDTLGVLPDNAMADTVMEQVDLGYIDVGPGQSLYEVSFATGLPIDSLLNLNPLVEAFFTDSSRLAVPAEYASVRYVVKRGDTLFKIARASGTTVAAIRAANALSGDVIRVGQLLTVPSTRVVPSPASIASLPMVGEGEARVYPDRFDGRLTASGRPYDPEAYTVSHRDLPIGSIVLLRRSGGGQKVFAEVTDRLPGSASYLVDASRAVIRALGESGDGNLNLEVRVVRYGMHSN